MVRRLRSWSGVVLFAYLVTHFANHALGLISLNAMEAGREWFVLLWRNPLGTAALYGALLIHFALVLWALYERRSLRMPGWQAGQILLGLMIPPLLAGHIIGTRLLAEIYGIGDTYTYVVLVLWEFAPEKGLQQVATLIVAWLHGCMGLHFWLRTKPWDPSRRRRSLKRRGCRHRDPDRRGGGNPHAGSRHRLNPGGYRRATHPAGRREQGVAKGFLGRRAL
jgi:adenylate cyclase